MTYTLDVRGDQTFVVDHDNRLVALVQPDTYHGSGWSSWWPNRNVWDAAGYDYNAHHNIREQALSAVGYHEGGSR